MRFTCETVVEIETQTHKPKHTYIYAYERGIFVRICVCVCLCVSIYAFETSPHFINDIHVIVPRQPVVRQKSKIN